MKGVLNKKLKDKMMAEPEQRQVLREAPGYGAWISVADELPEYDKRVLVCCLGTDGEKHVCAGKVHKITRHIGKESPKDNRWYACPGWGHELSVTHWAALPEAP